jgi:hypothetical protein
VVAGDEAALSGGGWAWRTRWVWRCDHLAPRDQAYEDEVEQWYWARLRGALGDDFGLGSTFDRIDKRKLSKKEKAKQIIQALLNKTEKRGATKDETIAAQRKAKELMAKYGVREEELLREVV